MKISELWVYPIKGMGGQSVSSAYALESGFKRDRRYMLIDLNNKFISQRTHPKLAQLSVSYEGQFLKVQHKFKPEISIDIPLSALNKDNNYLASVWKSKVNSFAFEDSINKWFSHFLDDSVKLVQQASLGNRSRSLNFKPRKISLSYADGYPFLVLSKASVSDLSDRMQESIDIRQFRANIILEDCKAYEEDEIKNFSLGEAQFKMVKPCKRCQVIDIHQDTGESHQKVGKALGKYRRELNAIIFGMNAANLKEGTVNIGDVLKLK